MCVVLCVNVHFTRQIPGRRQARPVVLARAFCQNCKKRTKFCTLKYRTWCSRGGGGKNVQALYLRVQECRILATKSVPVLDCTKLYFWFFGTVHTRREHTATRTSSRTYCTNRTDIVCYAPARCEETLLGSACRFAGLATVSFACGGTKTESIGVNKNSRHEEKYRRKKFRPPPIHKQQAIRLSAPRPSPGEEQKKRDVGVWLFWGCNTDYE